MDWEYFVAISTSGLMCCYRGFIPSFPIFMTWYILLDTPWCVLLSDTLSISHNFNLHSEVRHVKATHEGRWTLVSHISRNPCFALKLLASMSPCAGHAQCCTWVKWLNASAVLGGRCYYCHYPRFHGCANWGTDYSGPLSKVTPPARCGVGI